MKMIDRRTWDEFRELKLLWWTNRILHAFGWAIVLEVNEADGPVIDAYPARVKFRGFEQSAEEEGFVGLTRYLKETINELEEETKL